MVLLYVVDTSLIGKKITKAQQQELDALDLCWCSYCRDAKNKSLFLSGKGYCVECRKVKQKRIYEKADKEKLNAYQRDWRQKNLQWARERNNTWSKKNRKKLLEQEKKYRSKNPEKVKNYPSQQNEYKNQKRREKVALNPEAAAKKASEQRKERLRKNPEKRLLINARRREIRAEKDKIYYQNNPAAKIGKKIRSIVRRVKMGEKSKPAIYYTGTESTEDFLFKMTEKSSEKEWVKAGWHIDHIWQIHWFDLNSDNWEEVCFVVNNHRNLIPSPPSENLSRGKFCFQKLDESDLAIYEKFLKPEIAKKIRDFFAQKV